MNPFNDFNGVMKEVNYEKSDSGFGAYFGRSTPVELEFGVEKHNFINNVR